MSEAPSDPITIARGTVVQIHYVATDESGEQLESTRDGEPLAFLFGYGQALPAMVEAKLPGCGAGATIDLTLPPEQAYGARREGLTERMSKKHIVDPRRPRPGDIALVRTRNGIRKTTVTKVGSSVVDLDLNHPFAGRTVRFEVEVVSVREADRSELAHGHAHGPGGHGH